MKLENSPHFPKVQQSLLNKLQAPLPRRIIIKPYIQTKMYVRRCWCKCWSSYILLRIISNAKCTFKNFTLLPSKKYGYSMDYLPLRLSIHRQNRRFRSAISCCCSCICTYTYILCADALYLLLLL